MSKSKSLTVIKNHQEESPRVINWLSLLFFFSLLTAFLVFQVSLDQQNQTKELWQDYSWQDLFPHPYPPSVLLWQHRELQHQPWWHLHIEIQNKYILCCHQALLETSHQGSNLCPKDTYISLCKCKLVQYMKSKDLSKSNCRNENKGKKILHIEAVLDDDWTETVQQIQRLLLSVFSK